MKRALMYATTTAMIKNFNMDNIRMLQEMGYAVEVATNFEKGNPYGADTVAQFRQELRNMGVEDHQMDIPRSVLNIPALLRSVWATVKLCNEKRYELIHCHTPIGSVICRLAYRLSKHYKKAKMIYTAHGFHFFKGAPKKNWLLFYPMEKICSGFTDTLITINREDHQLALTKMKARKVEYIPGVGVDLEKFSPDRVDSDAVRAQLGIPADKAWVMCVGELIPRKDHETLIRAAALAPELFVTIVGYGQLQTYLEELIRQLDVGDRVKLLGFRSDVAQLCGACDLYAFPSLQEGLPVAVMEAMAMGKAVVCSDVRGNHDLIDDAVGGYLLPVQDAEGFAQKLGILAADPDLRRQMGAYNRQKMKTMDISVIRQHMRRIYEEA